MSTEKDQNEALNKTDVSKSALKFEYGFSSVNGIVKKVYHLHEIPNIKEKCDVWNVLPIAYVRQFTGETDIDGKEIFVGDIVKTHEDWDTYKFQAGEINEVYFGYGGFRLKAKNPKAKGYWLEDGKDVKIIGNIFENPELLAQS